MGKSKGMPPRVCYVRGSQNQLHRWRHSRGWLSGPRRISEETVPPNSGTMSARTDPLVEASEKTRMPLWMLSCAMGNRK